MYCPRCACQNVDDAKFCRACRANLETVALALADERLAADAGKDETMGAQAAEKWLEKRSKGARNAVQGAILMATAILIGVALALFSNKSDWMIIWTIFFGWLAGWGAISLALGLGAVLESKVLARQFAPKSGQAALPTSRFSTADNPRIVSAVPTNPELASPSTVTEHTTAPLDKQRLSSK